MSCRTPAPSPGLLFSYAPVLELADRLGLQPSDQSQVVRVRSPAGAPSILPAMSDEAKKTKPGPEPERLVIEDDPAEALDRLLGKTEWREVAKHGLPDARRPHEIEDEEGHRRRVGAGESVLMMGKSAALPIVRWRYLD